MSFFNRYSVRTKLYMPLSVVGLLFLLIAWLGITALNKTQVESQKLESHLMPVMSALYKADTDLHQAMLAERSLLLNRGSIEELQEYYFGEFREDFDQALERTQMFQILTDAGIAPDRSEIIAEFQRVAAQWLSVSERNLPLAITGDEQLLKQVSLEEVEGYFQKLRDLLDLLLEEVIAINEQSISETNAIIDTNKQSLWAVLVIGLALLILIAVLFPILVTKRLDLVLHRMHDIAEGDGDLTSRIDVTGEDEIAQLGKNFNLVLDQLHDLISGIAELSEGLKQTQDRMVTYAESTSDNMVSQSDQLGAISTAVVQMSEASASVTENAQSAASHSSISLDSAMKGLSVLQKTKETIQALSEEMHNASDVISQLQQNSININSVIEVINGIAEQTNLLALNAAIEAARAGEQGRGFAVVADEVRTLAGRTQESTTEIKTIIEQLQGSSGKAVEVIEAGVGKTSEAVESMQLAEETLQTINAAINQIRDLNDLVASASEEQSQSSQEINNSMHTINKQSGETNSNAKSSVDVAQDMDRLTQELISRLGRFRL